MHAVDVPKRLLPTKTSKKVHKIIFDNRKVKFIEIAETLKISKERVGHIVDEYLDMRKLCSKWVPRELTTDQKQQRKIARIGLRIASASTVFSRSGPE